MRGKTEARGPRHLLASVQEFFGSRIWTAGHGELRRGRAFLYRASRILYATFRGFQDKRLTFRAAGLTYYSILSIVPFLAFVFAVVKGFGGYQRLLHGTLAPYLHATFGSNPTLLRGLEEVLGFVERTDVSSLGAYGGLVLAYTAISLLATIETSLNDIWGAKSARPLLRRVTDYTTLLVVTPLLALTAITLATAAQSSWLVQFLRDTLAMGPIIDFALKLTSLLLVSLAMFALYLIMPNTRTKVSSAALGGLVGGLLWQLALVVHVHFQMGVAGYNALYSGFAALPIFLAWMYVSWMIVLFAAELAANHQHEQTLRQMARARHVDQEVRETLALAVATETARAFLEGQPPRTAAGLADALEMPQPAVEEVLEALCRAGVLVRAVVGSEVGLVPARDLDALHASDVRTAVRRDPKAAEIKSALDQKMGERLRQVLHAASDSSCQAEARLSLRRLAELARPMSAPPDVAHEDQPVMDAKQPEVTH